MQGQAAASSSWRLGLVFQKERGDLAPDGTVCARVGLGLW